jgi:tripartite-type tricarboxylate transporter receptor subunit TctC
MRCAAVEAAGRSRGKRRRSMMRRLVALLALVLVPTLAPAQDRSKPIRVILATGVGGTADVFMRVVGEEYHRRFGRPFVIENRAGGGMNIGGRACAEAPNDGSTICSLPNPTLTYNLFLYKKLPYDPERFEPITNPFFGRSNPSSATNYFNDLAKHFPP